MTTTSAQQLRYFADSQRFNSDYLMSDYRMLQEAADHIDTIERQCEELGKCASDYLYEITNSHRRIAEVEADLKKLRDSYNCVVAIKKGSERECRSRGEKIKSLVAELEHQTEKAKTATAFANTWVSGDPKAGEVLEKMRSLEAENDNYADATMRLNAEITRLREQSERWMQDEADMYHPATCECDRCIIGNKEAKD